MKKLLLIAAILSLASCVNTTNQSSEGRDSISTTTDAAIGNVDWEKEALLRLIQDSIKASTKNDYFTSQANGGNRSMYSAIDKLNSEYTNTNTTDARVQSIIQFLRKRNTLIKQRVMPAYRKAFAKNLAAAMWEYDIYVTASGAGNTILNVTGATFASNSNIKTYYEVLNMDAGHFEFRQIRFRWYKGADDYTQYTLQ